MVFLIFKNQLSVLFPNRGAAKTNTFQNIIGFFP